MEDWLSTLEQANATTSHPHQPIESWWWWAVLVILVGVGVGGNVVLGAVFLAKPWNRPPLQVDRVVGLLSLTGLLTSITTLPPHLLYFNSTQLLLLQTTESGGTGSLCQVQGFMLNLLCLLSLWYTAVLALERYVRLASPHEHSLTFSLLNLSVVVWGVLVVLLIEVSGPIYGWAQYGYVPECGVCVLSPSSTHILTYAAVHTSCYVAAPALAATVAALAVIRRSLANPPPPTRGSQVLKTAGAMVVLCCAVLCCVMLLLPYHLLLLLQASQTQLPAHAKVVSYWLKICGMTSVYPSVLLFGRPSEVWPALTSTLHRLRRCGRGWLGARGRSGDLSLPVVGENGSGGGGGMAKNPSKSLPPPPSTLAPVTTSHPPPTVQPQTQQ